MTDGVNATATAKNIGHKEDDFISSDAAAPIDSHKAPEKTPDSLPVPLRRALDQIPDEEARAVLSVALSRTTVGPDPETAKIAANAEMHEEECKLKAYQASLQNRELQNQRDHQYRTKRLNHSTLLTVIILSVTILGIGTGLTLSIQGNSAIGNPILAASFTMLSGLAGKLLASRDKD